MSYRDKDGGEHDNWGDMEAANRRIAREEALVEAGRQQAAREAAEQERIRRADMDRWIRDQRAAVAAGPEAVRRLADAVHGGAGYGTASAAALHWAEERRRWDGYVQRIRSSPRAETIVDCAWTEKSYACQAFMTRGPQFDRLAGEVCPKKDFDDFLRELDHLTENVAICTSITRGPLFDRLAGEACRENNVAGIVQEYKRLAENVENAQDPCSSSSGGVARVLWTAVQYLLMLGFVFGLAMFFGVELWFQSAFLGVVLVGIGWLVLLVWFGDSLGKRLDDFVSAAYDWIRVRRTLAFNNVGSRKELAARLAAHQERLVHFDSQFDQFLRASRESLVQAYWTDGEYLSVFDQGAAQVVGSFQDHPYFPKNVPRVNPADPAVRALVRRYLETYLKTPGLFLQELNSFLLTSIGMNQQSTPSRGGVSGLMRGSNSVKVSRSIPDPDKKRLARLARSAACLALAGSFVFIWRDQAAAKSLRQGKPRPAAQANAGGPSKPSRPLAGVPAPPVRDASAAVREWTAVFDDKALAKDQKSDRIAKLESGGLGLDLIRQAADRGDGAAEYLLGYCYDQGIRVEQDVPQGKAWLRKSAEHGHACAQFLVGLCQEDGSGIEWIRKAAEQGYAPAQENLGFEFLAGNVVAKDPVQAVAWLRKAADQGSISAKTTLGVCYHEGLGVPVDKQKGLSMIREAAAQGDATAKKLLDKMKMLTQAKAEQAAKEQAERENQERVAQEAQERQRRRDRLLATMPEAMKMQVLNGFRTGNPKGQQLFKEFKESQPELKDATPEQRQQAWLVFVAEACDANRDGRLDNSELAAPR